MLNSTNTTKKCTEKTYMLTQNNAAWQTDSQWVQLAIPSVTLYTTSDFLAPFKFRGL